MARRDAKLRNFLSKANDNSRYWVQDFNRKNVYSSILKRYMKQNVMNIYQQGLYNKYQQTQERVQKASLKGSQDDRPTSKY